MNERARILVVAATDGELAEPDGWATCVCGVGPVDAAAATSAAIAQHRPAAVLHVGIAGARRARGLAAATLVIGTEARYSDLGVDAKWAPDTVAAAPLLLAAVARVLPNAPRLAIATSARVGGGDRDVEAMEGFAVLRAAQLAGVPAIEVRAISNEVEEADRARWRFGAAKAVIIDVTPRLVAAITRAIAPGAARPSEREERADA